MQENRELPSRASKLSHAFIMSRSRVPLLLGVVAAGGVGYYLYGAGGNPKAAEKKFESESQLLFSPKAPVLRLSRLSRLSRLPMPCPVELLR